MNDEQFERLVKAVQFAIDDRLNRLVSLEQRPRWTQTTWARGNVVGSVQVVDHGEMKEVCASGCCLAGNVVLAEGGKFVTSPREALRWSQGSGPGDQIPWLSEVLTPDGRLHDISELAEELLGMSRVVDCGGIGFECQVNASEDPDDNVLRHDLFSGDNQIEDILHIASIGARQYDHDLRSRLVGVDDLNLDEEVSW